LASNATNATNVGITTHVGAGTSFLYFGRTASGNGALGSTTSITVAANTGTITATNFSGLASNATKATNVAGGTSSAGSSILIQTGVDTTGFLAHPGSAGQALTTTANGLAYGSLTSLAVTSVSAGTAMQVSANTGAVTITNNGVHSVSGTNNRVNVSVSG
jgi:hypothetical protein